MNQFEKENLLVDVIAKITTSAFRDISWAMKTQLSSPEINNYTKLAKQILKKAENLEAILTGGYKNNPKYMEFIATVEDRDISEMSTLLRAKIRKDVEWPCDFGRLEIESDNIELETSPAREIKSPFIKKFFK